MSIFSKIFQRGPEEGDPAASEVPASSPLPTVSSPPAPAASSVAPPQASPSPPPAAPPIAPVVAPIAPAAAAAAPLSRTVPAAPERDSAPPRIGKPPREAVGPVSPAAPIRPPVSPAPPAATPPLAGRTRTNTNGYQRHGKVDPATVPAPGMVPPRPGAAFVARVPPVPPSAPATAPSRPPAPAASSAPLPASDDVDDVVVDELDDGRTLVGTPALVSPVAAAAVSAPAAAPLAPAATATATAPARDGTSTPADREALIATFADLAVPHTAQVRSLMLEVQWGEPPTSWLALARPALRSLRRMADQIGMGPLTGALDGFDAALDAALAAGAAPTVTAAVRDALLAAYAPLVAALPPSFALEGERDRREPVIVRALLQQVAELDPLMTEKMIAAGLGRLEALYRARADEITAVAAIPAEVASAVASHVKAFRAATPGALAAPDPAAAVRELRALVQALGVDHRAFEEAARGWSETERDTKKQLRRRRERAFLQSVIVLARLGEVDLALRLDKLPFARRIESMDRYLAQAASTWRPPEETDGAQRESPAPAAP